MFTIPSSWYDWNTVQKDLKPQTIDPSILVYVLFLRVSWLSYDLNLCLWLFHAIFIWAASWQNQQNGMCTQPRLRSAWASAQSDQSLRWMDNLIWVFNIDMKDHSKRQFAITCCWCPGWSASSLGALSFCWFCHEVAHLITVNIVDTGAPGIAVIILIFEQGGFSLKHCIQML